ncbi:MAG: Cohesin domain [Candidatus Sumerlaeota bacterium]|nr:Cohesin domain [Candidatus Sumerlaeota bacterium]
MAQEDDAAREERLRQHEERVRQIIEKRRQERLGQKEGEQANQPVEPIIEEKGETQSAISLGNMLLYNVFRIPDEEEEVQLDTVVRAGSRFVSEIRLHNEAANPFDRVRIALQYDKRFLRPVRIFDADMREGLKDDPAFEVIERDSIILYDAVLERPRISKELPVLKIVWEALRPTEYTGLQFTFASGDTEKVPHTAVYYRGANVLGNPDDPIDGVLGGSILVLKPFDPNNTKPEILQGKASELRDIYLGAVASKARVGLALEGPAIPPAVDQEFTVDVVLNNPSGALIDSLMFFIRFDPEVLEVIDQDRGNWIKRGVNVHDGPFRLDYPFDFHKRNDVDNRRGYINYAVALGEGLSLPTGPFARIHFRAKAPVAGTTIELLSGRPGLANRTSVQTFGFELMTGNQSLTKPLLEVAVLPEPFNPFGASGQAGDDGGQSLPRSLFAVETFPRLDSVEQIPARP